MTAAEDEEVVGIRDDLRPERFTASGESPMLQESVHVQVGQQRTDDTALRRAYVTALIRLLELENSYGADPDRPSSTVDEINERLRKRIGLTNSETARSRPKPELLDELIRIADEQPERFFKLVVALLPRPSVRRKFGVSNRG